MKTQTHNQRVLYLLSDGKPHSHLEIYDLHVVAHSRISNLRAQGHSIRCWREGDLYWYELAESPLSCSATEPAGADEPSPRSNLVGGTDAHNPAGSPLQLSLEAA